MDDGLLRVLTRVPRQRPRSLTDDDGFSHREEKLKAILLPARADVPIKCRDLKSSGGTPPLMGVALLKPIGTF